MTEKIKALMPHIGMRKIKSIISVFVSFWVWQVVRLVFSGLETHPIYMYIYGIVEIRDSSDKTTNFGKLRIKATFTSFAVGLPLLVLSESLKKCTGIGWQQTAIELTILMIGIVIVLIAAEKVGCKNFCGIAAIIFVILMVSHSNDENVYIYAILRALQTIMGVFVAWVINVKLLPYPKKS